MQNALNFQENALDVPQDLVVPESDDAISPALEPRRANAVIVGMLPAIDLNNKLGFGSKKIDDIGSHGMLATKAKPVELLSAQARPQPKFRIGEV